MRVTVLGGCGAWPEAGGACSGFLVEHDGFSLLLDAGYATFPRLLELMPADRLGAVIVTHGHPDHCADLSPLLRARALDPSRGSDQRDGARPLRLFAPPGALDAVLALDRPSMVAGSYELRSFVPGDGFAVGPFRVGTRLLPHWETNAGVRVTAGGATLAYTGDSGPSEEIARLADDADVLVAEATYAGAVPPHAVEYLSSARTAGRSATAAAAGRLVLTHLWPGTDRAAARKAAVAEFGGPIAIADSGLALEIP